MVGKKTAKKLIFRKLMGTSVGDFKRSIVHHLENTLGKDEYSTTSLDWYKSIAMSVRDRLMNLWNKTQKNYYDQDAKRVYYLSLEFLMGRTLSNGIVNLGVEGFVEKAVSDLGHVIEDIEDVECDAGLGNGGLGRLAACYLDSMATLQLPGYGYGIRYEYGTFTQEIRDGQQVERPDHWLRQGNVWEIERPENSYNVKFGGFVKEFLDDKKKLRHVWLNEQNVLAVAYDTPIPGYKNNTVNTLRLWSAKSTQEFDFDYFNHGDYIKSVEDKNRTENISRVLYPNDKIYAGKELRLKQQYFFVAATLQDIIRRYKKERKTFSDFPNKVAIQLNDTHPSLAIPELMRILVDNENLSWKQAWNITTKTFAYTNHTILPEALEKWPVSMFERVLPRHLQIIYEINRIFLYEVAHKYPGDSDILTSMSIIEEGEEQSIRMAHLAIIGSHSVNGVAKLHSKLVKKQIFPDFAKFYPKKFNNKTNGITQRRWLKVANPLLAKFITRHIGDKWVLDLNELKLLLKFKDKPEFKKEWRQIKHQNKLVLCDYIAKTTGIIVDPKSMFDVQIKRMHEYKRQLLNILHVIYLYNKLKKEGINDFVPRTVIFAGKAAPGYYMAKLIIQLILAVGDLVNNDKDLRAVLTVVFLPNYGVSMAEKIFPASDLSEQISTAGMEASGTGNMKFALNGALTIGTLDGANIEIKDAVGDDNIFIFGLTADEVEYARANGYNPREYYDNDACLQEIMDMIADDYFSPFEKNLFLPIFEKIVENGDYYMHFADFRSYVDTQKEVACEYTKQDLWTEKSIINVANMGAFSSDRAIKEYANDIWKVKAIKPKIWK